MNTDLSYNGARNGSSVRGGNAKESMLARFCKTNISWLITITLAAGAWYKNQAKLEVINQFTRDQVTQLSTRQAQLNAEGSEKAKETRALFDAHMVQDTENKLYLRKLDDKLDQVSDMVGRIDERTLNMQKEYRNAARAELKNPPTKSNPLWSYQLPSTNAFHPDFHELADERSN